MLKIVSKETFKCKAPSTRTTANSISRLHEDAHSCLQMLVQNVLQQVCSKVSVFNRCASMLSSRSSILQGSSKKISSAQLLYKTAPDFHLVNCPKASIFLLPKASNTPLFKALSTSLQSLLQIMTIICSKGCQWTASKKCHQAALNVIIGLPQKMSHNLLSNITGLP